MSQKKPLEPLIPLDELKSVIAGLLRVPKDNIEKPQQPPQKRPKKKT